MPNMLWILKARLESGLWEPWYDKTFSMVVRAPSEQEARELAQKNGGEETGLERSFPAWTSAEYSTCDILVRDGDSEVVIVNHHSA